MPPVVSPTPEEARATRRAKLFARWSQGGRLSKDQEAEVADLIAAAKGETAPLALESPPVAPASEYLHGYRWYADSANLDIWEPDTSIESRIRCIKRWVKAGRERTPQDFPPFDSPTQLGGWLRRVGQRDLKKRDRIFAMAAPPPVPGEVPASKNSPPPQPPKVAPPPSPPPITYDLDKATALSALDNLEKFRRLTGAAYQLYADALLKGTSDVDQRHRAYLAASAELRKIEKDTEELREARGELIPRDTLVAELRRIHTAMAGSLRSALTERRGQPLTPELEAEIITIFFRPLRTGDFGLAETTPPGAEPAPAAA